MQHALTLSARLRKVLEEMEKITKEVEGCEPTVKISSAGQKLS